MLPLRPSDVLVAEDEIFHAQQARRIIARPDYRHHQMLVRPQKAASLARLLEVVIDRLGHRLIAEFSR